MAMLYDSLSKKISNKRKFSIFVECKEKSFNEEGGVSINFYATHPNSPDANRDILFHFNPRPPNKLILNTFIDSAWQKEAVLVDDEFRGMLFERPFTLTIELADRGTEFMVSVNKKFLTWYLCPADIRNTSYLGYSPALRIQQKK